MENNKPTVPPIKESDKKKQAKSNSKLKIIIPVVAAVIIAAAVIVTLVLVKGKDKGKPITVTDSNGVPYTELDGTPVTVIPESEAVAVTNANGEKIKDANGNTVTTIVYKEVKVKVAVTDKNGVQVTDKSGEPVYTEEYVSIPASDVTTGSYTGSTVGTSAEPLTDGQGHTATDTQGQVITTMVPVTEAPTAHIDPAKTEWKFTQGGTALDYISDIILTPDNCYITANVTNSKDGDFKEFKDSVSVTPYTVLTKTDNSGKVLWKKDVGVSRGTFQIMALASGNDGSFYAAGYGKNVEGTKGYGYYDGFVAKYSESGEMLWIKKFGTSTVDYFNGIKTTKDGGVIAVGSVGNNDYDAKGFGGKDLESRACIVKYSASGELIWKNIVGGNQDYFNSVAEDKDGNLYTVGNFYSGKLFKTIGNSDSAIVKFTKDGKYVKALPIAGKNIENFRKIIYTTDGNLVTVGYSNSADTEGDSLFQEDLAARGNYDAYIIKASTDLVILNTSPFRGQYDDKLENIIELPNGNLLAVGYTNSTTRDLKGVTTRGGTDIVLASFNSNCDLLWARSFGGSQDDSASAICLGADGGYVVAGRTCSRDVDLQGISVYASAATAVGVAVKFPE